MHPISTVLTSFLLTVAVLAYLCYMLYVTTPDMLPEREEEIDHLPDGSLVIVAYNGSPTMGIVSSWTRSKWNHVAIVFGGQVYEATQTPGAILKTDLVKWRRKIRECHNVAYRIYTGPNSAAMYRGMISVVNSRRWKFTSNMVKWAALIARVELHEEEEIYCAKFVREVLVECGEIEPYHDYCFPGYYLTDTELRGWEEAVRWRNLPKDQ
jgi:hypothetical protein